MIIYLEWLQLRIITRLVLKVKFYIKNLLQSIFISSFVFKPIFLPSFNLPFKMWLICFYKANYFIFNIYLIFLSDFFTVAYSIYGILIFIIIHFQRGNILFSKCFNFTFFVIQSLLQK